MIAFLSRYDPRASWIGFLVSVSVFLTCLFVLLKPDVSSPLSGAALIAFWALHVTLPLVLLQSVQSGFSTLPAFQRLSPWIQFGISGFGGAALFTPVAALLDEVFNLSAAEEDPTAPWPATLWDEFTGIAPLVILVWLGLNATRMLRLDTPRPAAPDAPSEPTFMATVPRDIGRELVALSAELHYLRVYTTGGEALVLHSFGQAVAELAPAGTGVQIHRSHWVALAHIDRVARNGNAAHCVLTTGLTLPISRARRATLKAAREMA